MRFVVGKGGVGKSTVAAATALALARTGSRVLVVSLDQAHSLSEVLGVPRSPGTAQDAIRDVPGVGAVGAVEILELDTLAVLEQRLAVAAALVPSGPDHDHGLTLPEPEELTALPGAQEFVGLAEVTTLAGSGDWDEVVVDCPATADTVRLLTAADLVADGVERIWPRHARATIGAGAQQWQLLAALLADWLVDATAPIRALLGDPDRAGVRLVVEPRAVAVAEARRTVTALALLGLELDDVVVNGVVPQDDSAGSRIPDSVAAEWLARRGAAQAAALTGLRAALADLPVHVVSDRGDDPVGWDALGALADDLAKAAVGAATSRGGSRAEHGSSVEHESGVGVDSVYALRVPLPLVDPASITLGRMGDDLLIGAAGVRRRMPLASVLRRCEAVGADVEDDRLVVRFRPDPEVWPQ
ncbi:ArsA family ATPase [Rhodococcus sp. NPDC058532]|uniref:ArsA family ATPase n=1 Tax=Rhodococcus sp. NPDC058532 TaxID=3346540 RepID=UPI00365EC9E8